MQSRLKSMVLTFGILMLAPASVLGFGAFDGAGTDCKTCHTNFGGPGAATHDLHGTFIPSCLTCHASVPDVPVTSKCAQCHRGAGVQLHHINAGTFSCWGTCHQPETPIGENFPPPLYGTASTTLTDSCNDNLDNDGDLKTDGEDPNCTGTAVSGFSWTAFKSLFR